MPKVPNMIKVRGHLYVKAESVSVAIPSKEAFLKTVERLKAAFVSGDEILERLVPLVDGSPMAFRRVMDALYNHVYTIQQTFTSLKSHGQKVMNEELMKEDGLE